jgi:acyl-coenzyme A thioesterase 13
METKNQLEILQKYIGQEFSVTPSPFMKWLQPIVLKA